MDGKSLDIKSEQLEKLKSLFPEILSEGKIDFEKLKLTLGDELIPQSGTDERYVLNWAGKSDAFRAIQTPTTATLKPMSEPLMATTDYADGADGYDNKIKNQRNHLISEINGSDNIFIEGENLEVLKVLQKSYYNKVKMIYIDPPYNTGNDNFIYPDKFSETKEEYLKRIGEMDEEGYLTKEGLFRKNSKESGRYHSNWLSMIYPRLFLARNLLRDDGVIFVSIDDNEVHNLRLLMNEIFGEENFVAVFPWRKRTAKSDVPFRVSQDYEWVTCYAKSKLFSASIQGDARKYYESPDLPNRPWRTHEMTTHRTATERPNSNFTIVNPRTGEKYPVNPNAVWRVTRDSFKNFYRENRIVFPGDYEFLNISRPVLRYFKDEDEIKAGEEFGFVAVSTNLPKEAGMTQDGTKDIGKLFDDKIFGFPKPVNLIKHFIKLSTAVDKSVVILDFFAGSGTTAQAVLELNKEDGGNRKFILVQLPEKTDEESEAYKAGYKTIAEICKERIRRVIKRIRTADTVDYADINDKRGKQEELSLRDKDVGRNAVSTKSDSANRSTTDLGFKVFRLEQSNFKIWRTDTIENEEDLKKQMEAFIDPVKASSTEENMAWEILLKSGYELTTKVEAILLEGSSSKKTSDKSTPDQNKARKGREQSFLPTKVYSVAHGEMMLAFNTINEKVIEEIIKRKPKQFICLDKIFDGNDQLKTNTVLQMRDAGIGFTTV